MSERLVQAFLCQKTPKLHGAVSLSGSKNSGLKLALISPIFEGPVELSPVPNNTQVKFGLQVLNQIGTKVEMEIEEEPPGLSLHLVTPDIKRPEILNGETEIMRHVFLAALPILFRTGQVTVPLPGYSHYGPRPVLSQLSALRQMGISVSEVKRGRVSLKVPPGGLKGTEINLAYPSVAATDALLLTAVASKGKTVISGAAQEPEQVDVGNFFIKAGVKIEGLGTPVITIESGGLESLDQSIEWKIIPDRIEAATFAAAIAVCGGEVKIVGVNNQHMAAVRAVLTRMGVEIIQEDDGWKVISDGKLQAADIVTRPYPGFPTDAQGPYLTALALAKDTSTLHETVWPNRLSQAMELNRMGADINVFNGNIAIIKGGNNLSGTSVIGTDPRATAGLMIAGLKAEEITTVYGADLLDNAYEAFDVKMRIIGANIRRVTAQNGDPRSHPDYGRLEAQ